MKNAWVFDSSSNSSDTEISSIKSQINFICFISSIAVFINFEGNWITYEELALQNWIVHETSFETLFFQNILFFSNLLNNK